MSSTLVVWLFDLAASLPLRVLHRLGAILGWLTYQFSSGYAHRLRENIGLAWQGHDESWIRKLLHANVTEIGKGAAELAWVWRRPLAEVLDKVRNCYGFEFLEAARKSGRGVILLTPHMGCFEIIALYVAERMPMTSMYRPPKLKLMDRIVRNGRQRGQMNLARTDVGGVRTLFKALKRGEVIGLLPDQVPGNGEGEWAEFFGRPAYTMTLVGRLAEASGAAVLMSYSERLPHGSGYDIHITPLEFTSGQPITRQVNAALEKVILACPTQYLWGYNRYKVPAGAEPAPQPAAERPGANRT